jgi:S-DNA-T family DNA segregation ATPase FtsK/SpoIIIE
MIELLAVPALALLLAAHGDKLKRKLDDKKKIQVFFEVAGIAVRRDDKLQYPTYEDKKMDDRSTTYIYTLPLAMPSEVLKKIEPVVSEGLGKPVRIKFDNYKLHIRVFHKEIPETWDWTPDLVQKGKWIIPMGQSFEELIYHDFDKTPHMTLGGLTRMGKTVFLKMLFTTLALANPDYAKFYIIDLKGGLEFHRYRNLKQVAGVAETPEQAHEMLRQIEEDMLNKMMFMKEHFYTNITETSVKERIFVIIDEGAQLCPSKSMPQPQQKMLERCHVLTSRIAAMGGALGFREIFCSQYPTSTTLPRDVKQNADAKVGFRLPTATASQVVIDEKGLESLPSIPGRALFKTDRVVELQVPYIDDKLIWELLQQYEVKKDEPTNHDETTKTDGDSIDD